MNSSGIKRGLATTAVSALAIAGLPLFASTASAAAGDEIQSIAYKGPVRDAGTNGGLVVLKTKNLTAAEITLVASDLNVATPVNTPGQTVSIVSKTLVPEDATNEFGGADGYDEIWVRIAVDTPAVGDTAKFALYGEDGGTAGVQANEARVQVEMTTSGAPTSLSVAPQLQTAAQGVDSGDYTVAIKDSAGRPTQLTGGEQTVVNPDATTRINGDAVDTNLVLNAAALERGTATFVARSASATLHTIDITGPGALATTAQLDVVEASGNLTPGAIDIVTGADGWDGFGGGAFGAGPVPVRVDQKSARIDIRSTANAGKTVVLNVSSANITFDGKDSKQYTVKLDDTGRGSITITPDAATILEGRSFDIDGTGVDLTLQFQRASLAAGDITTAADTYVSKIGGSVDIVATVVDQFGNPVPGAYVRAKRVGGVNADTNFTAKKQVDANGNATFTFTDTKATATLNTPDDVFFEAFVDEFAAAAATDNTGDEPTIVYTADGLGQAYTLTIDGVVAEGAAYDPTSALTTTVPLTDGVDSSDAEDVNLGIVGGTTGAPVTVTADNGALVLRDDVAATTLANGQSTVSGVIGTNTFEVIGTKTGIVNVTVTSGGRTKTAQFNVKALADNTGTARNVAITGPTSAVGGGIATFTAKVTDAFGNPVVGFQRGNLNIQVSGPGSLQDGDAVSNAAGEIKLNVRLADNAGSPVTVSALATSGQFGAAANRVLAADTTNTGPGLGASTNSASATIDEVTDIQGLEQAVEEAQAALDEAEANLAAAQANLDVAQAELAVAQANVDSLKAKKAELRKKLNKAKANDNKQKAKTTRKKLRAVKRNLRAAQDNLTVATVKVDSQQKVVDLRQDQVDAAQADLDEAQANLDEAQG